MANLTSRTAIEGIIRRVQDDGLSNDYIHKCFYESSLIPSEKLADKDFFEQLEASKKSNAGTKNKDEGVKKIVASMPRRSLKKPLYLPDKGEMEVQIHSEHPVCLLAEFVDLDLTKLEERNLAYFYLWRARSVVGEGILDILVDDEKRPKDWNQVGYGFPEQGKRVTFIYIVTRPLQGLKVGELSKSGKAAGKDKFR
jgi:hypothetical protein